MHPEAKLATRPTSIAWKQIAQHQRYGAITVKIGEQPSNYFAQCASSRSSAV
jgi:hypothetical protein